MGGTFKWPDLEEVVEYRKKVKEVVLSVIDNTPLKLPVTQDSPWVSPQFNACTDTPWACVACGASSIYCCTAVGMCVMCDTCSP